MRRCEDCQIILDSTVRFCPKCGKQVGPAGAPAVQRDVNALLASANLHRIRQEWEAAIADATEALKVDPRNPDIASILADIYEQRGQLDDAMIWCQMSLELNPDSAPEKSRLERIRKKSTAAGSASPGAFRALRRRVKIGAMVMAGVFILILVLALIARNRGGGVDQRSGPEPRQRTPIVSPGLVEPGTTTPNSSVWRPSMTAPLTGGQAGTSAPIVRTIGEGQIRAELQGLRQTGVRIDDAIVDPRQGVLIVTFSVGPDYATRNAIIAGAGALAQAVFKSNREVNYVTARCLVTTGDASTTQLAFVGDVSRTSLDSIAGNPTPDLVAKAFTTQWWNQGIK